MPDIERKLATALADQPTITTEGSGEGHRIRCCFATYNAVDRDNDILLPGCVPEGKRVAISGYNHASWTEGKLPIGMGVIRSEDNMAVLEGQLFDTQEARDVYQVMREMGDLVEFSFGFTVNDDGYGYDDEGHRLISGVDVYEVSPVLKAAGVDTGLLELRSAGWMPMISNEQRRRLLEMEDDRAKPKPDEDPKAGVTNDERGPGASQKPADGGKLEAQGDVENPTETSPKGGGMSGARPTEGLGDVVERIVVELVRLRVLLAEADRRDAERAAKYDTDDYNEYQREYQANLSSGQRRDRYEAQQRYVEDNVRA